MPDFDSFDALTESPKDRALEVTVGNHTFPWLADGLAIERAKREGHELGEILSHLQVIEDLMETSEEDDIAEVVNEFSNVYPAVARLLWLGFIRFEKDLSFDAVLGNVGPSTLDSIPLGQMMQQLFPEEDDETTDREGKE